MIRVVLAILFIVKYCRFYIYLWKFHITFLFLSIPLANIDACMCIFVNSAFFLMFKIFFIPGSSRFIVNRWYAGQYEVLWHVPGTRSSLGLALRYTEARCWVTYKGFIDFLLLRWLVKFCSCNVFNLGCIYNMHVWIGRDFTSNR